MILEKQPELLADAIRAASEYYHIAYSTGLYRKRLLDKQDIATTLPKRLYGEHGVQGRHILVKRVRID